MKKTSKHLIVAASQGRVSTASSIGKFIGTTNMRHLDVLNALYRGECTRKDIETIADVGNGPGLIAHLRRLGLSLPCERKPKIDKYGWVVWLGLYSMSDEDFWQYRAWLKTLRPN